MVNTNFHNEKDDLKYSDGDIEQKILDKVRLGYTKDDINDDWATLYHLSELRENILNWYNFKDNCSILEIGAGCGALTGLLTRKAEKVVACELTARRAAIIEERYKNVPNLQVYVSDINNLNISEKFDYVTLVGVLEYAGTVSNIEGNPFVALLKKAAGFLKKDGIILLAIENRFGIKYFNAAPEDHLGKPFSGINGYDDTKIRTFTKRELEQIVTEAGLKTVSRFYPYPDYKFPTEIFSDTTVNSRPPLTEYYPLDSDRKVLFNEYRVTESIVSNGVMDVFANSFLFELQFKDTEADALERPDYVKISNARKPEYKVYTELNFHQKTATKKPLCASGSEHIKQMYQAKWENEKISNQQQRVENGNQVCELLSGPTMAELMLKAMNEGKPEVALDYITALRDSLYCMTKKEVKTTTKEFKAVFGDRTGREAYHWLDSANIDLIPSNIFVNGDKWTAIDCEWTFMFPIPAEFVIWRSIKNCTPEDMPFSTDDTDFIAEITGVEKASLDLFFYWNRNFEKEYIGAYSLPYKERAKITDVADKTEYENKLQMLQHRIEELQADVKSQRDETDRVKLEIDRVTYEMNRAVQEINSKNEEIRRLKYENEIYSALCSE